MASQCVHQEYRQLKPSWKKTSWILQLPQLGCTYALLNIIRTMQLKEQLGFGGCSWNCSWNKNQFLQLNPAWFLWRDMAIAIYVLGPLHTATSGPKGTFLYSNYQWITSLYLPLPSDADWPADMSKRLLGMICCVVKDVPTINMVPFRSHRHGEVIWHEVGCIKAYTLLLVVNLFFWVCQTGRAYTIHCLS